MEIITLKRKILIPPNLLDSNIREHLYDEIKKRFLRSCSKEHGYILEIKSLDSYETSTMGVSCHYPNFMTTFTVLKLQPIVGSILESKITMPFEEGILADSGPLAIMIPKGCTNGYVFDHSSSSFINLDNDRLNIGSSIKVQLTQCEYTEKSYKCIGKIME
jgi:DNA-directed RNA polymerase subunit E'/Rpb7